MTIRAILTPPQERRFRELCAVKGRVKTTFDGWSKRVVVTEDRAFLFPRDHTKVEGLERERAALEAVSHPLVPAVVGWWEDEEISP